MSLPSNQRAKSFIMLSSNRAKDLETLEEKVTPTINHYFEQGIYDIQVRLFLCVRRNDVSVVLGHSYIYTSKAECYGIEKSSNRYIRIHRGTTDLIKYAVAYWKYDHARSDDIKWNVLTFHTDGYELSPPDTDMNENVYERAKADAKDGIMWRIGRDITNFLYKALIGSRKPAGMKSEKQSSSSSSSEYDSVSIK